MFVSQAGTPLVGANIRRALASALKTSKIQDFHFHDLRHTCATRMVQAGVDLYKVQHILGHKSPMMTQRYAHHYPESLRDGVESLDAGRTFSTNLAQSTSASEAGLASH
ncbi:MAG TPA: site-specific integrase [Nitrospira sp.]